MQLLTSDQAIRMPYERRYRHSLPIAVAGLVVVTAATAASLIAAYVNWTRGEAVGAFILLWIGIWAGLFALLLRTITRQRMHPSNWLVRVHSDGLSIKFRSYLNDHFDSRDLTVVRLSYSEIEYARPLKIRRNVTGSSPGRTETRYLRFAEFKLRSSDALKQIEEQTALERSRKGPQVGRWIHFRTRFGDYPVQVVDGFLRVQWMVWPRLPRFMKDLESRVRIRERESVREDFQNLKNTDSQRQEEALLRLIASGDRMGAIRTIRQIYNYDLTRAVQFLDELTNSSAPAPQRESSYPQRSNLPEGRR